MNELSEMKEHLRLHPNDIYLGNHQWIKYIDLEGLQGDAKEIDDLLAPVMGFIDRLEVHCVARCCGFGAYDFTESAVTRAAEKLDVGDLVDAFHRVCDSVGSIENHIVVSSRMNNYANKQVMLELLGHIRRVLGKTDKVSKD